MFLRRRSARWAEMRDNNDLCRAWRSACEGSGATQEIDTVSGATVKVPRIGAIHAGPPIGFTVELLPGQLITDLRAVANRLAPHLGAKTLRLTPIDLTHARVDLLVTDPLEATVAPAMRVKSALDPIILGIGEDGRPVSIELASAAHLIVQGTTGGGKSVGLYSLLGQVSAAPDIRITGVDPTGLLLRPWCGRWSDTPDPAIGTSNPTNYVITLTHLVKEMDARIAGMPSGHDSVDLGRDCPVILVVLEEYPGILRILDTEDTKLGKLFRALVGRLLAEGRKAGIRVTLITQRADAAIIGAYERGQASHRISYRVDSIDGLKMLHPDLTPDVASTHATSLAGVALATMPGQPLTRLRSPYLAYGDYCASVVSK